MIEWIKPGMVLSGVVPGGPVSIVAIQPLGPRGALDPSAERAYPAADPSLWGSV
ncbi:hypothetical protein D3C76_200640 [compost metagenome]